MHTDLLERYMPRLLDELADERTPDYYADLFWQTAHTSQRPAWTIRERWLPVLQIARQPVVAQPPWRAIGLLILLVGTLAAGLVLAGARQKMPPLIGPAGNGLVVILSGRRHPHLRSADERDQRGDQWPEDRQRSRLVAGRDDDSCSVAKRRTCRERTSLMIARANGTSVKQLTPEPMPGLSPRRCHRPCR